MPNLPQKYDFKLVEAEVSKRWDEYKKEVKDTTQYDPKKKVFSFLEGPPTANAPPGLHHMEMRVFKDVMCRYKYMQGFTVPRKGGWDCHGLPVEVQVEKKLGLKTKKDVLNYGIAKFNQQCKTDIFTFIKDWELITKKLAFWVDMDDPYRTLDNKYIESVWWSLKELFNKKLLYEGYKVVPYCPRCETPLSSHEVALGYQDVSESTVVVKLKQKNKPNRYFLAWTTTPWTLPSNMCLAVNKEITYAVVRERGEEYVLAKDLVSKYFEEPEIVEELSGEDLVGQEYEPLFDYYVGKLKKKAWFVVEEDYVTLEEGTGIVHQAPAYGEIDYESCERHNVPFVHPVDVDGKFKAEVSDFQGMFVKEADPLIIRWLEAKDKLFKTIKYMHSYPFCWRCSTPLLYYAMVSWFIKTTALKDRLIETNQEIDWNPEHIREGRYGKWLENLKDWALSRTKFWGTPLPIWKCECKNIECIGSIKELQEKGKNVSKDLDLHKPFVDDVQLKCKCGKTMTRIPDVIDCWYDSGSAPFAQFHYPFENKELFEKRFPYDFIAEGIDQTRGWFYTLHVLAVALFDKLAYKRCDVGGILCDDKGEKMSKSKGNIIIPGEIFAEVGVDIVRILMCSYSLGESIKFGRTPIKETLQPFFTILWNSYKFYDEFMDLHDIKHTKKPTGTLSTEDEWILSRINTLVKEVQEGLENGAYNQAITELISFVNDDLSRGYIKLIRDRALNKDESLAYTFSVVFDKLFKLLSPFAPYLSEYLFQHAFASAHSVHFTVWPIVEKRNEELEKQMGIIKEVISAILAAREKAQLGLKWPAKEAIIVSTNEKVKESVEKLNELLLSQTNIKVAAVTTHFDEVNVKISPNKGGIGKTFGNKMPEILKILQKTDSKEIAEKLLTNYQYEIDKEIVLKKEHFNIERTYPKKYVEGEFADGFVYLDTTRTEELEAEGFAREITRRVQAIRKDSGLQKSDQVSLTIQATKELKNMLTPFEDTIREKCGAKELNLTTNELKGIFSEEKIKDEKIKIKIEK
ncbi:isoleucine--tRNA ligase [Candidatus Woesearchaeota archaeon]|nr:isoleucine--tRNA ligase [Candidatus Woesearchaeota archaeon]